MMGDAEDIQGTAMDVVADRDDPMTLGRRAFIAGGAGAITGVALASGSGRFVSAAGVEPGASYFVSVDPQRFCDTRLGFGYTWADDSTIRVPVGGVRGVPAEAVAVVLTLTGVNLSERNWLSAYPTGTQWPGTSSSNLEFAGQAVANLVTVKLGTGGAIDIKSLHPTHVVVDVTGYYLPTAVPVSAGRLETVEPFRIMDTRTTVKPNGGQTVTVNLNGRLPPDAVAVVANVTAVETDGRGFITAYPIGQSLPVASNLNFGPGDVRAVAVMAKLGSSGGVLGFNLYVQTRAHLVVDVLGYITGPSSAASDAGLFVPIAPQRLLDTRQRSRRVWPGGTVAFVLPSGIAQRARAAAMNLTVTSSIGPGFFTPYAAQTPRRLVSALNVVRAGQTIANHTFSKASTAGIACYSHSGAHIIADVTGWYTGGPESATVGAPIDPPPPGGPLPWIVQVPRMGLTHAVLAGDADTVVDSGNTWHWTGTGLVGQGANAVLFGHRTNHGGPYRYQHLLVAGDLLYISTADQRRYTYRMAAEYLTSKYANEILEATRRLGGETVALVACTGDGNTMALNRLPGGSTQWRMVSVFQLVGWEDLG